MTYPTNQIPSNNPQNITVSNPVGCEHNPRNPNAQDNTFPPGWEWQNTLTGHFFKCVSATIAGAVWTAFVPSAAGTVSSLTGNSGGNVGPDGSGNINVVGDGTTITIAGNPGTNTLTASLVGGGVASQSYVTNVSGPVTPTAAGVIDLNASTSTYTDGGTANTVKIELQGTNHTLFVGRGVHSPATTLPAGTANQILVSNGAGADPSWQTSSKGFQFQYFLGTSDTNQTGNATVFFVGDTSVGGHSLTSVFDTTGGAFTAGAAGGAVFTAPVTGFYYIYFYAQLTNLSIAFTSYAFVIASTPGNYLMTGGNPGTAFDGSNNFQAGGGIVISLAATNTVKFSVVVSGSTKTIGLNAGNAAQYNTFVGGYIL